MNVAGYEQYLERYILGYQIFLLFTLSPSLQGPPLVSANWKKASLPDLNWPVKFSNPSHPCTIMSQPRCQDAPSKIFAALCQKFPNIPAKLVISIVFHDFAALDLYTLPLQFGNVNDRTTPFRCPGATYEQRCASAAVAWSREPNLVFRHLCTYFSILSAYFIGQPDLPLGFFRYLDHLKHLSVMHEWTPVHKYHVEFFNNRVGEMRHGDFSKWAVPEASLLKKYGFDRESFLPEPHQYATNKILYNGKLWRLDNDPTRGQIRWVTANDPCLWLMPNLSFILRRTRDPFAAELQYIAQIKLTTKHLDMNNLPIGQPGEKFHVHRNFSIENVTIWSFPPHL